MNTIKVGNHTVTVYEGIDEMPIVRYQKFNRLMLIESGVGSTIEELDTHLQRAIVYCMTQPEHTYNELMNLRQCFNMASNGVHPGMMAFAAFVKSVDGVEYPVNASDSDLKAIFDSLSDATINELSEPFQKVKKKIEAEVSVYFPRMADDPLIKQYYDIKLSLIKAKLDKLVNNVDNSEAVKEIEDKLLTFFPPRIFYGTDSVEIKTDKEFQEMCLVITQNMHINAREMSVSEFYTAFEMIKRQAKRSKNK